MAREQDYPGTKRSMYDSGRSLGESAVTREFMPTTSRDPFYSPARDVDPDWDRRPDRGGRWLRRQDRRGKR